MRVGKVTGFAAIDGFDERVRFLRRKQQQFLRTGKEVYAEAGSCKFTGNAGEGGGEFFLVGPRMISFPFETAEKVLVVSEFFEARDGDIVVSKEGDKFGDDPYLVVALEEKASVVVHPERSILSRQEQRF